MEITTTITTCVQLRRLAMPSIGASFDGTRAWYAAKANAKHVAPGVPVWSSPHC